MPGSSAPRCPRSATAGCTGARDRDGLAALEQRGHASARRGARRFLRGSGVRRERQVVGLLDIGTAARAAGRTISPACWPSQRLADYGGAGRIDRAMQERVEEAIRTWHEMFTGGSTPGSRCARRGGAVLATGPHRQQEASGRPPPGDRARRRIRSRRRAEGRRMAAAASRESARRSPECALPLRPSRRSAAPPLPPRVRRTCARRPAPAAPTGQQPPLRPSGTAAGCFGTCAPVGAPTLGPQQHPRACALRTAPAVRAPSAVGGGSCPGTGPHSRTDAAAHHGSTPVPPPSQAPPPPQQQPRGNPPAGSQCARSAGGQRTGEDDSPPRSATSTRSCRAEHLEHRRHLSRAAPARRPVPPSVHACSAPESRRCRGPSRGRGGRIRRG